MKLNKLLAVIFIFAALAGASQFANAGDKFYCKYNGEIINVFQHMKDNGRDVNMDFLVKCCAYKKDLCRPTLYWKEDGNNLTLAAAQYGALPALKFFVETAEFPLNEYFTFNFGRGSGERSEYSELMHAIANNDFETVSFLLSLRPTREPYANPRQESPLFKDAKQVMDDLIEKGVKIDSKLVKKVNEVWKISPRVEYTNPYIERPEWAKPVDKDGRPEMKEGPDTKAKEADIIDIGFNYNYGKTSKKETIVGVLKDDKALCEIREKFDQRSNL